MHITFLAQQLLLPQPPNPAVHAMIMEPPPATLMEDYYYKSHFHAQHAGGDGKARLVSDTAVPDGSKVCCRPPHAHRLRVYCEGTTSD
jgi:hypothetical protein